MYVEGISRQGLLQGHVSKKLLYNDIGLWIERCCGIGQD